MTSVIFDPDARAEFLSAVQYYENCHSGLGRRFRLVVESAVQDITESPFRYRVLHLSGGVFCKNFHMRSSILLSQTIFTLLLSHILSVNLDIG